MTNLRFWFLLVCSVPAFAYGGQSATDSLKHLLEASREDSNKVNLLCSLAEAQGEKAGLEYAMQALALSEKLGYKRGTARSCILAGKYYYFTGNYSRSLEYCIKGLSVADSVPDYRLSAVACRYIGYNHFQNDPHAALEYYKKSAEYCRLAKDELLESYALSAIGNLYESWKDGKGALTWYQQSLDIRKRRGSPDELVSSYIETARAYGRMAMYDQSFKLVLEAQKIAEEKGSNPQNLSYIYQMIGYHYSDLEKDFKKALEYFLKSYHIAIAQKPLGKEEINSISPVADMYYRLGEFGKSAEFYRQYFRLMEENNAKVDKQLYELQDSLRKETEKKILLQKDSEILKQKAELQRDQKLLLLLVSGIILVLVSAFFVLQRYRLNKKQSLLLVATVQEKTRELVTANEQLRTSEERLLEANKELEAFVYKASHDLKGPLVSARGLADLALEEQDPESIRNYLRMLVTLLEKQENILLSLHELSLIRQGSLILRKIDIGGIIDRLIRDFSGTDNFSNIKFNIDNRLEEGFYSDEILVNTVLRNVIENAIKYSRRDIPDARVDISIGKEAGYFVIQVSDNGIGIPEKFRSKVFEVFFRATELGKGSGLGLYIVKNAMNKLGGKIEIFVPTGGQGTTFRISFPS